MSTAAVSPPAAVPRPATVPADPIWRLSVEQYHGMVEAGILTADDPVELLDGWLVTKTPKEPPHRIATRLIRQALEGLVPGGWYVDSQEPVTLPDSEPEPDVMVVRGDTREYFDRHPGPRDLALVVEVADATLERDRSLKKRLYAEAGIAVYWIVDLVAGRIEVLSDPTGPGSTPDYRQRRDYGPADSVPVRVKDVQAGRLDVRELLP